MASSLRGTVFLAAIFCAAAIVYSDEPKPVEIPLKDIWAERMLETKSAEELEPEVYGEGARKLPSEQRAK